MKRIGGHDDPRAIELCYRAVLDAAVAGIRCPANRPDGITSVLLGVLARMGRVRVDISGRNWRRVTILTGPSAGRATAPDPRGHQVWKVRDKNGTRTVAA